MGNNVRNMAKLRRVNDSEQSNWNQCGWRERSRLTNSIGRQLFCTNFAHKLHPFCSDSFIGPRKRESCVCRDIRHRRKRARFEEITKQWHQVAAPTTHVTPFSFRIFYDLSIDAQHSRHGPRASNWLAPNHFPCVARCLLTRGLCAP